MSAAPFLLAALTAALTLRPVARARRPAPVASSHLPRRGHRSRGAGPSGAIAVTAAVLVVAIAAGVEPAVAAAAIVAVGHHLHRRRASERRRRQREAALPDTIELLVMTVHAGHAPGAAVVAAAPFAPPAIREALDAVILRFQRGQRLADALGALVDHVGPSAHAVVDAIATADRYGLPLAPVLDRLAADARDARRRTAEAHARTLPVRLSFPLVVCTLPSFVLLAIAPAALATISSLQRIAP